MRPLLTLLFLCAFPTLVMAAPPGNLGAINDGPVIRSPRPGDVYCPGAERIEYRPTPACGFNDFSLPNIAKFRCYPTSVAGSCTYRCVFDSCSSHP